MNTEALLEEIQKLTPAQKQMVRDFLADDAKAEPTSKLPSLRELLSQSPFARMDFEPPEGVRSPVRPVEV